jgi:hypothetical protein
VAHEFLHLTENLLGHTVIVDFDQPMIGLEFGSGEEASPKTEARYFLAGASNDRVDEADHIVGFFRSVGNAFVGCPEFSHARNIPSLTIGEPCQLAVGEPAHELKSSIKLSFVVHASLSFVAIIYSLSRLRRSAMKTGDVNQEFVRPIGVQPCPCFYLDLTPGLDQVRVYVGLLCFIRTLDEPSLLMGRSIDVPIL